MATYITKAQCIEAASSWATNRIGFEFLKSNMNKKAIFEIETPEQIWLNTNSANSRTNLYLGYHAHQTVLIFVPIDINGDEVNLSSYAAIPLTTLSQSIILQQEETITKTLSIELNANQEVVSRKDCEKTTTLPYPQTKLKDAIAEIEMWQNHITNWFYDECTINSGAKIPQAFATPTASLLSDDLALTKAAIWGLKKSEINQSYYPTFIFATIEGDECKTNTLICKKIENWSTPVPPFLALRSQFTFLPV